MSEKPASVYGIKNKGVIKKGFDADLVLVDMKAKRNISRDSVVSKCGWSAFEGREVLGLPLATFVHGQMVFREGDVFDAIKGKEIEFF